MKRLRRSDGSPFVVDFPNPQPWLGAPMRQLWMQAGIEYAETSSYGTYTVQSGTCFINNK